MISLGDFGIGTVFGGLVVLALNSYVSRFYGRTGEIDAESSRLEQLAKKAFAEAFQGEAGKRLASHQDVENVLSEVRKVTTETESIKAQISGDTWLKQTVWVEKRKAYAALLKSITVLIQTYRDLSGALGLREMRIPTAPDYIAVCSNVEKKRGAAMDAFFDVMLSFAEVTLFDEGMFAQQTYLLGRSELDAAMSEHATSRDTSTFAGVLSGFQRDIIAEMRRELGVPESSGAASP